MSLGRISENSIAAVRSAARLDQVVGHYVTLKRAGGGTLKGLCPFHDEKSPSFHVTPDRGFYHCFGCGESGDAIDFVQKLDGLSFVEAIERLAETSGTVIERVENGTDTQPSEPSVPRARLIAANNAAAALYAESLFAPEGIEARRFLSERGFRREAAAQFGVGYAPDGWTITVDALRKQGFSNEELLVGGIASEGKRGLTDRFRNRLMFPIRDVRGEIIGFGGRKLSTDASDNSPKYLNTSETPIYKKSRVLFGLDMARKGITTQKRVIVVEGYTDVMACHLAGETTAVATCGTAFGEEHIRIIRRLLGDDGSGGEVIYTFDGDSAGQKAALKAFGFDHHFQSRTTVAVDPAGMDPCEVRLADPDNGIKNLIADRRPLFEFAIKAALDEHDLETPEGRANALTATVPILLNIRHVEMRESYARFLAQWVGTDINTVYDMARRAAGSQNTAESRAATISDAYIPDEHDEDHAPDEEVEPFPRVHPSKHPVARDVLKVLIQGRKHMAFALTLLHDSDFLHPTHRAAWEAAIYAYSVDGEAESDSHWVHQIRARAQTPTVAGLIAELSVEPVQVRSEVTYDIAHKTCWLLRAEAERRHLAALQSKLNSPGMDVSDPKFWTTLSKAKAALDDAELHLRQIDGEHF